MEVNGSSKKRLINFSAGPCQLPLEVLEDVQKEIVNYRGWGLSVMEMSHRGRHFRAVLEECQSAAVNFLQIPRTHALCFMAGGSTAQFAAEPLNLLNPENQKAAYAVTGYWSKYAMTEAQKFGQIEKATDAAKSGFVQIDPVDTWNINPESVYMHYCDNETIHGLEYPEGFLSPLASHKGWVVADLASNLGTKPVDWGHIDLAYAGGQKNIGIAGVTLVAINREVIAGGASPPCCPLVLDYRRTLAADSCLNTPPTFNIYVVGKTLMYLSRLGDLGYWDRQCRRKSDAVYGQCDMSDGFYTAPVKAPFRSRITVRFDIKANQQALAAERADKCNADGGAEENGNQNGGAAHTPQRMATDADDASMQEAKQKDKELTDLFVKKAEKKGLICLNGHRSLGGLRASVYSGVSEQHVEELVAFMKEFREEHAVV